MNSKIDRFSQATNPEGNTTNGFDASSVTFGPVATVMGQTHTRTPRDPETDSDEFPLTQIDSVESQRPPNGAWPRDPHADAPLLLANELQNVLTFIEERLEKDLYIAELCKTAGVSERNLQMLFRRELGVRPMQYIKRQRLLVAKRMLEDASSEETSVKVVALSSGFRDLGRFSGEYRAAFGESPSETLRRSPT